MINGIDISHWNGSIDFDKVKASGIDFVIIKAGGNEGRFYQDPKFEEFYWKALAANLKIGAYYFAGKDFRGAQKGIICAEHFLKLLGDLRYEYPLFLDIEAQENKYKEEITDAAVSFCRTLEEHGFFAGIYASDISGFKYKLDHDRIKDFAHWVARYGKDPEVCKTFGIWQYSSKGSVPGIVGPVDLDRSILDYASIIRGKGLNNNPKVEENKEVKKTNKRKVKKDGI